MKSTHDIRREFVFLLQRHDFVADKSGCRMLEIVPADFVADESSIFGLVSEDYVRREIAWYESQSLNVNDIPGGAPEAWRRAADADGFINSNYGHRIWSDECHRQYEHVLGELRSNPSSRRASMIYTSPDMWRLCSLNGRSDFICTHAHTFHVRNGALNVVVVMRSNDVVFGYKNDRAWAVHVQGKLAADLGLPRGKLYWHADSLHVYERHFFLVDWFDKMGDKDIGLSRYREVYPDSPWSMR